MRILAAVTAAAICTAAGVVFSTALERRCRTLREIAAVLSEMQVKIRYRSLKMSELMEETASSSAYSGNGFIKAVAACVREGMPITAAWDEAASKALFLTDRDREILREIGSGLGGSDTDGQLSLLSLGVSMTERALEEAERERAGKSGMLMSVWTLCGIGAGILII